LAKIATNPLPTPTSRATILRSSGRIVVSMRFWISRMIRYDSPRLLPIGVSTLTNTID